MKTFLQNYNKKILLIMLASFACILFAACDPVLSLNPKYSYTGFDLELGQDVSTDISEYINMSEYSAEDAKFIKEHTEILFDGESSDGNSFKGAGMHSLTIMYNGHQYRKYDINITDHVAPVFTKTKKLYTFVGIPLDESLMDDLFEVEDNSGEVKLSVKKPKIDYNTAGEYKIKAVATDPSGNKTKAQASVFVQNPEYGAMGTYVFVSISKQHLTYFVDGKAVLDCPVVTGNTLLGHSTPRGTFRLNYKARNLTLKGREDNGDEYESFVNYWMAFIGSSYGLHDATWRGSFGGSIYQGAGSHGCVNMPYASAAALYEKIEPATLILIY